MLHLLVSKIKCLRLAILQTFICGCTILADNHLRTTFLSIKRFLVDVFSDLRCKKFRPSRPIIRLCIVYSLISRLGIIDRAGALFEGASLVTSASTSLGCVTQVRVGPLVHNGRTFIV